MTAGHVCRIWKCLLLLVLGCGIGQATETVQVVKQFLKATTKPVVLDADALNILAQHPDWFSLLPAGSILSPHPKEFSRLFGTTQNHFERIAKQRENGRRAPGLYHTKGRSYEYCLPGWNVLV